MGNFIANVLKVTRLTLMALVWTTMNVNHTWHVKNMPFVKIPQEITTVNAYQEKF